MSDTQAKQFATVISITEFASTQTKQYANIISITELPAVRVKQLAAILSVSPGTPLNYPGYKLAANPKGAMSLIIDMNANSKR